MAVQLGLNRPFRQPWSATGVILMVIGLRPWPKHWLCRLVSCGLIVMVASMVYANTLHNSFQLDDYYRVVDNPGIEKLAPIWRHFVDLYTSSTLDQIVQYRPLLPLTLSLNFSLAGDSLVGYHLANLLFQIVAGVLVYVLVLELLRHWSTRRLAEHRQSFLALAVALLFAIHPVSGILVNYISSRDLLLMQIFLSASLLAYLRLRRLGGSWQRWTVVLALLALSLLSKNNAVVAPLLVVAFELTAGKASLRRAATYLCALPFAAVIVGQLVFTTFYLRFSDLKQVLDTGSGSIWTYPLTQAQLHLFHYLANFFWPFPIRQEPLVDPAHSLLDARVLLGLAFIMATLVTAWRLRRAASVLSFCILAYWVLMIPESSVLPFIHLAVDYRPYPSSPFFFLALALLLERYLKPSQTAYTLLAFVVYFAAASISINGTWRTNETLWAQSVRYGGDEVAHLNLAMSFPDRRDPRVRSNLEEALALNPNYGLAHLNLGLLLIDLRQPEQGLAQCRLAVQLSPMRAQSWYWLARAYAELGRYQQAAAASARAVRLDPRNLAYQYEAAVDAQWVGAYSGSLSYLHAIEERDPAYKQTLFLKGFALWKSGRPQAAVVAYRGFLARHPDDYQAQFNLGYTLMTLGRCAEAVGPFKKTLVLKRDYTEALLHLVTCNATLGQHKSAVRKLSAAGIASAQLDQVGIHQYRSFSRASRGVHDQTVISPPASSGARARIFPPQSSHTNTRNRPLGARSP